MPYSSDDIGHEFRSTMMLRMGSFTAAAGSVAQSLHKMMSNTGVPSAFTGADRSDTDICASEGGSSPKNGSVEFRSCDSGEDDQDKNGSCSSGADDTEDNNSTATSECAHEVQQGQQIVREMSFSPLASSFEQFFAVPLPLQRVGDYSLPMDAEGELEHMETPRSCHRSKHAIFTDSALNYGMELNSTAFVTVGNHANSAPSVVSAPVNIDGRDQVKFAEGDLQHTDSPFHWNLPVADDPALETVSTLPADIDTGEYDDFVPSRGEMIVTCSTEVSFRDYQWNSRWRALLSLLCHSARLTPRQGPLIYYLTVLVTVLTALIDSENHAFVLIVSFSFCRVLILNIGYGLATGFDVLCPKAIRAGNPQLSWRHLMKSQFVIFLYCLPIVSTFSIVYHFLQSRGVQMSEPFTGLLSALKYVLPAFTLATFIEPLRLFVFHHGQIQQILRFVFAIACFITSVAAQLLYCDIHFASKSKKVSEIRNVLASTGLLGRMTDFDACTNHGRPPFIVFSTAFAFSLAAMAFVLVVRVWVQKYLLGWQSGVQIFLYQPLGLATERRKSRRGTAGRGGLTDFPEFLSEHLLEDGGNRDYATSTGGRHYDDDTPGGLYADSSRRNSFSADRDSTGSPSASTEAIVFVRSKKKRTTRRPDENDTTTDLQSAIAQWSTESSSFMRAPSTTNNTAATSDATNVRLDNISYKIPNLATTIDATAATAVLRNDTEEVSSSANSQRSRQVSGQLPPRGSSPPKPTRSALRKTSPRQLHEESSDDNSKSPPENDSRVATFREATGATVAFAESIVSSSGSKPRSPSRQQSRTLANQMRSAAEDAGLLSGLNRTANGVYSSHNEHRDGSERQTESLFDKAPRNSDYGRVPVDDRHFGHCVSDELSSPLPKTRARRGTVSTIEAADSSTPTSPSPHTTSMQKRGSLSAYHFQFLATSPLARRMTRSFANLASIEPSAFNTTDQDALTQTTSPHRRPHLHQVRRLLRSAAVSTDATVPSTAQSDVSAPLSKGSVDWPQWPFNWKARSSGVRNARAGPFASSAETNPNYGVQYASTGNKRRSSIRAAEYSPIEPHHQSSATRTGASETPSPVAGAAQTPSAASSSTKQAAAPSPDYGLSRRISTFRGIEQKWKRRNTVTKQTVRSEFFFPTCLRQWCLPTSLNPWKAKETWIDFKSDVEDTRVHYGYATDGVWEMISESLGVDLLIVLGSFVLPVKDVVILGILRGLMTCCQLWSASWRDKVHSVLRQVLDEQSDDEIDYVEPEKVLSISLYGGALNAILFSCLFLAITFGSLLQVRWRISVSSVTSCVAAAFLVSLDFLKATSVGVMNSMGNVKKSIAYHYVVCRACAVAAAVAILISQSVLSGPALLVAAVVGEVFALISVTLFVRETPKTQRLIE